MARSFYEMDMSELYAEYNANISKAENLYRRNGYRHSKDEYTYYVNAAEVAKKISAANVQQKAMYKQWSDKSADCEKKATEILRALVPAKEEETVTAAAAPKAAANSNKTSNAAAATAASAASAAKETKTADGTFTTKNANDDVSAETIRSWYREKPEHGLDDVVGMDDMKDRLRRELIDNIGWDNTDEYLGISKVSSYLFYGPFGTGKSYFIDAVASELMDKGFKYIQLTGSDVHDSYVGVGEKKVKAAFCEAVDNAPCILFVDELDNVCADRSQATEGHEKRLTVAFMESYNILSRSDKPVIFMAATNYPDKIEKAMMSRIGHFVPVPLPDESVRENYFRMKLEKIRLSDDLPSEYMADITDNYSFRDLKAVYEEIKSIVKKMAVENFSIYDEEGNLLAEESDTNVSEAIREGKVKLTKDLFDSIKESISPEKKEDILRSIEEFEKKN